MRTCIGRSGLLPEGRGVLTGPDLHGGDGIADRVEELRAELQQETLARHSDMCRMADSANRLHARMDQLTHEIREVHSRVRQEAIFLRAFFAATAILWAASRAGVADQVAAFMLGLSVAALAFQALKESRWVQRRIRNALIWWDTLQIRRGKR